MENPPVDPRLAGRFCPEPFRHFETLFDGRVSGCCSIWTDNRFGDLNQQSFDEIWNSEQAQAMRQGVLDGSFRHCHKDRCQSIVNGLLPKREDIRDPLLREIIRTGRTRMEEAPSVIFLAHDVTCNLSCPSCRSDLVVADEAQEARFELIEKTVIQPMLASSNATRLSVAGQGDPFASPHYRSILRYVADQELNIRLSLATNAVLLNEYRWQQYQGLEKYQPFVDVSIDACRPWTYAVLRRPASWEKLLPNLEFLGRLRAQNKISGFQVNATVQLDNFLEIPELVALVPQIGADRVRLYMIQNTGGHLAADYDRKNIADTSHPLHLAFLEVLRDPDLASDRVMLSDIGAWRQRALAQSLPSDSLSSEADLVEVQAAVDRRLAEGQLADVLALTVFARRRFGASIDWLRLEGEVLMALGFPAQAAYRFQEALLLSPIDIAAQIGLATARAESSNFEGAMQLLDRLLSGGEVPEELSTQLRDYRSAIADLNRKVIPLHVA